MLQLNKIKYNLIEFSKAHIRRIWKQLEVNLLYISPDLSPSSIVVATNIYNEVELIQSFLTYYRNIGITQFLILDNGSTDGLQDVLKKEKGISLFYSRHAYKKARYGIDWMNHIFNKYCRNKWILYVDVDEFFVYPFQDSWKIKDLVSEMERLGYNAMSCIMLDVYSQRPIQDNICLPGQNPFDVTRYFDGSGYYENLDLKSNVKWIKGGPRGRKYFSEDIFSGPALNKIPLIKWKNYYAYIKSTHELTPSNLNKIYTNILAPSGALIHFKFLSKFNNRNLDQDIISRHTSKYIAYSKISEEINIFKEGLSLEFNGWNILYEAGLISIHQSWIKFINRVS